MSILIISDTSCLIALDRIGQLELLQKLFQQIVTTEEVKEEFGKELPEWVRIVKVQNKSKIEELEAVLDQGEASAIALALETDKSLLIIDEKKGRKVAQNLRKSVAPLLRILNRMKAYKLNLTFSIRCLLTKPAFSIILREPLLSKRQEQIGLSPLS